MSRPTWAVLCGSLLALGCGGGDSVTTVPVSGVVTLDGKPLDGALVRFEPTGGNTTRDGWADASGVTDPSGRYALTTGTGQAGAVPGPQRVTISIAPKADEVDASTEGQIQPKARTKSIIPARYNTQTELTFDVPPGGTDAANFDLKSR